jgi:hypothetical protein
MRYADHYTDDHTGKDSWNNVGPETKEAELNVQLRLSPQYRIRLVRFSFAFGHVGFKVTFFIGLITHDSLPSTPVILRSRRRSNGR